jgi:hypothetical protein
MAKIKGNLRYLQVPQKHHSRIFEKISIIKYTIDSTHE